MRITRHRHEEHQAELDRAPTESRASTQRVLVQIFDGGSKPTSTPGYFVGHPVALRGDECGGCEATYIVDSDLTIPVYVLGGDVPAAGDMLVAVSVGGRWVAEAESTFTPTGPCVVVSSPCTLPAANLILSWTNPIHGDDSVVLVYNSTTQSWSATVVIPGVSTLTWTLQVGTTWYLLKVTQTSPAKTCQSPHPALTWHYYGTVSNPRYPNSPASPLFNSPTTNLYHPGGMTYGGIPNGYIERPPSGGMTWGGQATGYASGIELISSDCNPLSLQFDASSSCGWFSALGYTSLEITGPELAVGSPLICQTFTVGGCGVGIGGVTVTVYDHEGGTELTHGDTESDGKVWLNWVGPTTIYVTCSSVDRFQDYAATKTVAAGYGTTLTLTPQDGYVCVFSCDGLYPLASTLHATVFGVSVTLDYDATGSYTTAGFYGTLTLEITDCDDCPSTEWTTDVVLLTWPSCSFRFAELPIVLAEETSVTCAGDSGQNTQTISPASITHYSPGLSAFSWTGNLSAHVNGSGGFCGIYGGINGTVSVVITE